VSSFPGDTAAMNESHGPLEFGSLGPLWFRSPVALFLQVACEIDLYVQSLNGLPTGDSETPVTKRDRLFSPSPLRGAAGSEAELV